MGQARRHAFCGFCLAVFSRPLYLYFVLIDFDKSPQGPVVGPFHIVREKAGRELFHAPMILKTFAAHTFAAAGIVGTIADFKIFLILTLFHVKLRCSGIIKNQVCLYGFFQGVLF